LALYSLIRLAVISASWRERVAACRWPKFTAS
jgi:hypothetical protein